MADVSQKPPDLEDDLILFHEENLAVAEGGISPNEKRQGFWKVMIVDDDEDIHNITKLVLESFVFQGRALAFVSAYSAEEAKRLLVDNPDTALIFLDVVMETDDAGLRLAKHIRETMGNRMVRIVLRTGQPGQAPEETVILDYDIDDYRLKTEMTRQKMFTTLVTALRAFNHLTTIDDSRRELKSIMEASFRFVPKEFLSVLHKKSIVDVELGNQIQQQMTIMFADVRSFTALSEDMSPSENFEFINALLGQMCPTIRQRQGFIDKYLGDGVMALFPHSADDAVQAAIAMRIQLVRFNEARIREGKQPIRIGTGLHTGLLMLGTIGEAERMEVTVISDAVNLASRVEQLTKVYRTDLVISEQTLMSLRDASRYRCRFIDKVKVKGKKKMVSVYEVLDGDTEQMIDLKWRTKGEFEQGLKFYQESRYPEASVHFSQVLKNNPGDEVARIYLRRVAELMINGVADEGMGEKAL